MFSRKFNRHRGSAERLYAAPRKLAAPLLFLCLFLTGCSLRQMGVEAGLVDNPYYQEGDTEWDHGGIEEYYFNNLPSEYNEIYRELYSRLSAGENSGDLYARTDADHFWKAYYSVLADHPELFWLDSSAEIQSNTFSGTVVRYSASTVVEPEKREEMRKALEEAADACIAGIDPGFSDYGKIKAVYEYLINETDYDADAKDSQCVQSALLGHASVCAGYSKAFQFILHRMGYFCTYITGTIEGGGDHAWNIVRIDGNYYHVDVTWGDPVFATEQEEGTGISLMNYNYLCCTDEEIGLTHKAGDAIPLPACTEDYYNYYKLNGMYYESWDYDQVYNALMDSVYSGRSSIVLKFGSKEAYETARYELFENSMINDADQYLMRQYGVNSWNNRYAVDDNFYVIMIQWI